MSTKKTKALLSELADTTDYGPAVQAHAREALAEVEAIEKAARDLSRMHVGDYTCNVRDSQHVIQETPDGQDSWGHPDVKAWSDASNLMDTIAKESST